MVRWMGWFHKTFSVDHMFFFGVGMSYPMLSPSGSRGVNRVCGCGWDSKNQKKDIPSGYVKIAIENGQL